MEITLSNYRAFDDTSPARWELTSGFTAFVGVNNAGKSSLLRFIHEIRPCLRALQSVTANGGAQAALGGRPFAFGFQGVADQNEVFCNRNDRDMTARFALRRVDDEEDPSPQPVAITFRWRRVDAAMTVEIDLGIGRIDSRKIGVLSDDTLGVQSPEFTGSVSFAGYREAFRELAASLYLGPFRNAVNIGAESSYYDLAIGQAFIRRWDQFKTGPNRAENRTAIAVERELQQIFGLSKLEINAAPQDSALQIIADDQPYQLHEHGSGLAQFIVVLAFIATQRPAYVFIDEPELNLHPSLQLDFLTTIAKYCSRGVAFTTHNIGLARSVGQRVYSVRRAPSEARVVRALEETADIVEFLGELSYSGYRALGFDRILLVEGPSEIPAIQQWLRLYGIEHRVVLVPLGGSSMINGRSAAALAEIRRITTDVSVLIDSERAAAEAPLDDQRQAFVDTCTDLGFDVHVLERRALEHYLSQEAVAHVKGPRYAALEAYEQRGGGDRPVWGKNENWRIAAAMRREELEGTDLGDFLRRLQELTAS